MVSKDRFRLSAFLFSLAPHLIRLGRTVWRLSLNSKNAKAIAKSRRPINLMDSTLVDGLDVNELIKKRFHLNVSRD